MNVDKVELARRAVACKGWRWMPGMVTRAGNRASEDDPAEVWEPVDPAHSSDLGLPDLDDPATRGCLLALVREAWGDSDLHCERYYGADFDGWIVFSEIVRATGYRAIAGTEAEALVAALKAAPDKS